MTCAGIGGAKDSVTYLNIPVSSMYKVLIALRMDESNGGGGNAIVQICMRNVVQREQGKMPSFSKPFYFGLVTRSC